MTSVAQAAPTIEFPCEDWLVTRTLEGRLVSIKPIAGTWTLLSGEDRHRFAKERINIKGYFACPRCNQVGIIPEGFDPPKELGDGKLGELSCRRCQFYCRVILKDWDKRRLYCACYETREGDSLKPHKEYLHAENESEAKKFFWAQHGLEVTNLVGIAPALGFFMENPKSDRILLV